ncbi:MAG: thioredoxin family protein [Armatimonadota bacterium]
MNKRILILLATLFVLVTAGLAAQVSVGAQKKSIDWKTDFGKAVKAAQKAKKPLLVDFYTEWCGWCKKLDQDTYTNEDVIRLSKKFVCVKVDGDKHRDLVEKYKIDGYPAILFLDSKSKEVKRVVGYEGPKQFLQDMQDALKTAK